MRKILNYLATAMFCGCAMFILAACSSNDNAVPQQPTDIVAPAQLKQGIWSEYDSILVASGKYTPEEMEKIPSVGMMIDGDKGYFFSYTAEDVSELVEGKISYDKTTGTGTIVFPVIKDSPLSGQTVNFKMTTDETMEFELIYEGKKETGTCAWLCENLDGWNTDDKDSDWEELLTYYQNFPEDAGPDGSIDWSGEQVVEMDGEEVTVTGLDQPLTWDDGVAATKRGNRIAGAVVEGISAGLEIFTSLFEDDLAEEINGKLDIALGKLDQVLAGQKEMMVKLDTLGARLNAIALKMHQDKILDIFNNRDEKFYNKLKVRNRDFFNEAFELYNENKNDLSKVKEKLGEYGKEWAGTNDAYVNLTWEYILYLSGVQTSAYGKGMANIYDGLTFDKYPWEHIGIGDRKSYRAYDMYMIARSLFMINLYAAYGNLSDIRQTGIYNNYNDCKSDLRAFCNFKVSDPQKYRVCQIKGAHFIMHKELQKYRFCGPDNKCPHPDLYGGYDAIYRPEWHQAGTINIDNPKELKSKLITVKEASALYDYYKAIYKKENIHWADILVEYIIDKKNVAGGADYALDPKPNNGDHTFLMLQEPGSRANGVDIVNGGKSLGICPVVNNRWKYDNNVISAIRHSWLHMGTIYSFVETILNRKPKGKWRQYNENYEYYGAIVETRY